MVNGILSIRLNENLDPSCKWEIVPINTTYVLKLYAKYKVANNEKPIKV